MYTDTLARYSPLTGVIQRNFNLRYDLSAYPMNNAVWCVLLGIHPIVQSKVVMSVINMLMINLLIYQIGKSFFVEMKKSRPDGSFCVSDAIVFFFYLYNRNLCVYAGL